MPHKSRCVSPCVVVDVSHESRVATAAIASRLRFRLLFGFFNVVDMLSTSYSIPIYEVANRATDTSTKHWDKTSFRLESIRNSRTDTSHTEHVLG